MASKTIKTRATDAFNAIAETYSPDMQAELQALNASLGKTFADNARATSRVNEIAVIIAKLTVRSMRGNEPIVLRPYVGKKGNAPERKEMRLTRDTLLHYAAGTFEKDAEKDAFIRGMHLLTIEGQIADLQVKDAKDAMTAARKIANAKEGATHAAKSKARDAEQAALDTIDEAMFVGSKNNMDLLRACRIAAVIVRDSASIDMESVKVGKSAKTKKPCVTYDEVDPDGGDATPCEIGTTSAAKEFAKPKAKRKNSGASGETNQTQETAQETGNASEPGNGGAQAQMHTRCNLTFIETGNLCVDLVKHGHIFTDKQREALDFMIMSALKCKPKSALEELFNRFGDEQVEEEMKAEQAS